MSKEGIDLYNWLSKQREEYQASKMTQERIEKLKKLSVLLNPIEDAWKPLIASITCVNNDESVPLGIVSLAPFISRTIELDETDADCSSLTMRVDDFEITSSNTTSGWRCYRICYG